MDDKTKKALEALKRAKEQRKQPNRIVGFHCHAIQEVSPLPDPES